MIIQSEVAEKLESILNNANNPTGLYYQVETEGFHINHIVAPFNGSEHKNFIPVFVSCLGGQFNPVKGLKQGSYTYQIVFYFPVSFKESMFALGDYLVEQFVGQYLNYGSISGKAVSNISVPTFGEIQNLDLKRFEEWATPIYKRPIEIMENYLTMIVNLYLTNAADGLVYGNDVKCNLTFTYNNDTYSLDDVDIDGASLQSNAQPQGEQEEGTNESDSLPFGTSYGASFKIYPNLTALAKESPATPTPLNPAIYFYKELLKIWLAGNIQEVECKVTYVIANDNDLKYERNCYIQSIVAPIEKGQLFSMTLSFAKKTQFDEEE